jgi:hypothetical protein
MPEKQRAAPTRNRKAALEDPRTEIIADGDDASNQDFGACRCGARISGNVTTLRCSTCSAWRRWRSAFRIAAQALRGPQ